MNAVNLQPT